MYSVICPRVFAAHAGRDAGESTATQAGHYVAALVQRKLDCKGWRLVVTGHSLGAGAAALIALHLYGRFPSASAAPLSVHPCLVSSTPLCVGHSPDAGAAALIALHLYGRFPSAPAVPPSVHPCLVSSTPLSAPVSRPGQPPVFRPCAT